MFKWCFRGFQVCPGINQGVSWVFQASAEYRYPIRKRDFNVAYVHGNYTVAYLSHQLRRDLSFRNFVYANYKN